MGRTYQRWYILIMTEHTCPKCDYESPTDRGIKSHYAQSHGGSIAEGTTKEERNCKACGNTFEIEPVKENEYCSISCSREAIPTGSDNPLWDSDAHLECEQCGDSFEKKYRPNKKESRFCSFDCWSAWCKDHPERRDFEGYGSGFKKLRRKVRNRDTVCQVCGHDGRERRLECHHIQKVRTFEHPDDAHTMDNAVLLCASCHRHADAGRVEELLSRADSKAVTQFVPNQPSIEESN